MATKWWDHNFLKLSNPHMTESNVPVMEEFSCARIFDNCGTSSLQSPSESAKHPPSESSGKNFMMKLIFETHKRFDQSYKPSNLTLGRRFSSSNCREPDMIDLVPRTFWYDSLSSQSFSSSSASFEPVSISPPDDLRFIRATNESCFGESVTKSSVDLLPTKDRFPFLTLLR
mmetsp:Transcript_21345/g.39211  ORF Transcript_21345/g.39211 Transcript_21345/m.39211 type:complete len:172 (-) Transcript_21345:1789-2304(-)